LFVQTPFLLLSVGALLCGLGLELAAVVLSVDLAILVKEMGVTEAMLRGVFYVLAIVASALGIVVLRLLPRTMVPLGAVGPNDPRHQVAGGKQDLERVPHVNDPLQSIYVAVMIISGVLLVGVIT